MDMDRKSGSYWETLVSRGKIAAVATALALLPAAGAGAGTLRCSESGCGTVNWAQIHRQNEAGRLRGIQQQQRVCATIRANGRVALPAACR